MRKTFLTITTLSLVTLGAAACVSRSEYTMALDSAEVRYNALEAQNASLKNDLADAKKRNEQLAADNAQLESTLTAKSGEQGGTIVELRQRVSALERDLAASNRSEEHTSELQSLRHLVCRL